jgi:hypothetical protein
MLSRIAVFCCAVLFAAGTFSAFGQNPPTIVYTPKTYSLMAVDLIPSIIPVITGSVDSVTIEPNLPIHLIFDGSTGEISGSSDDTFPATVFIVRAYNANGSSADTITLSASRDTVGEPPTISYSPKKYVLAAVDLIEPITPVVTGFVDSVTITPNLPIHLIFDAGTGEITGAVDAPDTAVTYIVRACNLKGHGDDTITISVEDATKVRRARGETVVVPLGIGSVTASRIMYSIPSVIGLREIRFTLFGVDGRVKWSGRAGSGQVFPGYNSIGFAQGVRLGAGVYIAEMRVLSGKGLPVVKNARVTLAR